MKSPATLIAIGGIGAYQRFISPHKGFRCAHHACTGEMTCYGLHVLREYGFLAALPARARQKTGSSPQTATAPRSSASTPPAQAASSRQSPKPEKTGSAS